MDHGETPDMMYGRLREAVHVSGYKHGHDLLYLSGELSRLT
jgi:hypothetical protein